MRSIFFVLMVCLIMPVWAKDDLSFGKFMNAIKDTQCSIQLNHSECVTFKNFRDSVIDWFKNLNQFFYAYQNKEQKLLTRTRGFNEPLYLRLLMNNKGVLLRKGKRTIKFKWESGELRIKLWCKKFKVSHNIKKPSAKQIPEEVFDGFVQIQNNTVTLNLTFESGFHTIRLYSEYYEIQHFEVVDEFPSKIVIQSIEQSNLSEHDKKIFLAVWLISLGKQWEFEAYQQIADITYYYPAWLVKMELEVGMVEIGQISNNGKY